jgi:hypothetical protein
MFANPVEERTFEANIVPQAFRFQPLVSEYLLSLSQKLLVKARFFHEFP